MAVFDNLRNFIRHSKATDKRSSGSLTAVTSATTSLAGSSKSVDAPSYVASSATSVHSKEPSIGIHGLNAPAAVQAPGRVPSPAAETYAPAVKKIIAAKSESQNRMPVLPGLEQFNLLEKMGDGAFSVVYKAQDRTTGEFRAIKAVNKANLNSSQKASVLKEAAIMRQLDHPNIAKLHAFLETADHYFIVLELVAGGELFHEIVRLTYFSEDLARHVIVQVAHAVKYLHDVAGVVHRDIKPENLLFVPIDFKPSKERVLRPSDDDSKEDEGEFRPGIGAGGIGQIKLADFGLSKVIWNTKTMTPCGTVGYTAPEIVKDERYSKSVDMWALGCVLYTVLCGFPPFYDESIETLTRKVAKGQYTFLSPWWDDISVSAKDLVSRLLTVDPEKRYDIDEFLAHPWITQDGAAPVAESTEVAAHKSVGNIDGGRRVRDPALDMALKDAFDVSNAVYRMEEEAAHRAPGNLSATILEEEDEESDIALAHVENVSSTLEAVRIRDQTGVPRLVETAPSGSQPAPVSSKARDPGHASSSSRHSARTRERERDRAVRHTPTSATYFDLHLEGATLLERRRQAKSPVAV